MSSDFQFADSASLQPRTHHSGGSPNWTPWLLLVVILMLAGQFGFAVYTHQQWRKQVSAQWTEDALQEWRNSQKETHEKYEKRRAEIEKELYKLGLSFKEVQDTLGPPVILDPYAYPKKFPKP